MSAADSPLFTRILILSGPAGAGKSTIVKRLLAMGASAGPGSQSGVADGCLPVRLEWSVSATTRPPRPGEVHGKDYYFLNPGEFEQRRQNGEFVECAEVHRTGYWYGTLKSEIERIQRPGRWVLLEVDVEGALNIMQMYPQALSIFLQTPSIEEYETRLRQRGTESEEIIQRRLRTAREELKCAASYTHRVINDDLDRAVQDITGLVAAREAELHAG